MLGGDAQDHAVAGHALRPLVILLVGPAGAAEHENAQLGFDDHFEVVDVVDAAAHRARGRKALLDRFGVLRRAVRQQRIPQREAAGATREVGCEVARVSVGPHD